MVFSVDSSKRVKLFFFFFFFFLQAFGMKRAFPAEQMGEGGSKMKRVAKEVEKMILESPEEKVKRIVKEMGITDDSERIEEIARWGLFSRNKLDLNALNITDEKLEEIMPKIRQINEIKTIETLSLAENNLTTLPATISNLSDLTELNLSKNKLERLPDEIGKLTKLDNLNLENNMLQTLPDSIGNLTKLRFLWLHDNNQLERLPESTKNLVNLKKLLLPDNIKEQIKLSFLTKFDLHTNHPEFCEFLYPEGWQKSQDITIILGGNDSSKPPSSDPFVFLLGEYIWKLKKPFLVSSYNLHGVYQHHKHTLERGLKKFDVYKFKKCGLYLFLPKGGELERSLNLSENTESLDIQIQKVDTGNFDWLKKINVIYGQIEKDSENWLRGIKSFFSLKTTENFLWNVLLYGHGEMKEGVYNFHRPTHVSQHSIANLEAYDFKDLLTFFNEKNQIIQSLLLFMRHVTEGDIILSDLILRFFLKRVKKE